MKAPYALKDRDSGLFYRRGLNGQASWVLLLADASDFSTYEGAAAVAQRLMPQNYCAVVSTTFEQPELFRL